MAKYSYNSSGGVNWEVVSLPIKQGVDARANDRARDPSKLARLENGRFSEQNAITSRLGHRGVLVRDHSPDYPVPGDLQDEWLYGIGRYHPIAGTWLHAADTNHLQGLFTRDQQLTAWTGDRLLSYEPSGEHFSGSSDHWFNGASLTGQRGIPAYLPTADLSTFRRRHGSPTWTSHDAAQGRKLRVMVYVVNSSVYIDAVDAETGAAVVTEFCIWRKLAISGDHPAGVNAETVRIHWLNERFVVMFSTSDNQLFHISCSESDVLTWTSALSGILTSVSGDWDVSPIPGSESLLLLAHRASSGGVVKLTHVDYNGAAGPLSNYTAVASGATGSVAVSVNRDGYIGLAWETATGGLGAVYNDKGVLQGSNQTIESTAGLDHLAIAYMVTTTTWAVCWDTTDDDAVHRKVVLKHFDSSSVTNTTTRHGAYVAGRGFTIGDVPMFIWRSEPPAPLVETSTVAPVQDSYVLVAARYAPSLRVCGLWCRSSAVLGAWHTPKLLPGETTKLYCVAAKKVNNEVLFSGWSTEPQHLSLDFLPRLRTAQVGRCTYLSGALVTQFDGQSLVEAGFTHYPVVTNLVASNGAGALTNSGVYLYRVYAVARTSTGELTRSAALTSKAVTLGASDDTVTVTFTSLPFTNRDLVEFEIYRTTNGGEVFYLVSPYTTYNPTNSLTSISISFTDNISDTDLMRNVEDPYAASPGELVNFPPPGCTTLAAGTDRVWFAGGEVPVGTIACSKIAVPGETLNFSELVGYQFVDKGSAPITALGVMDDIPVIFRSDRIYLLTGGGPNNLGGGAFDPVRVLSSDTGATSQEGICRVPLGLTFVSATGPKLIPQGFGSVVDFAQEVAGVELDVAGAVVVPGDSQVRFYVTSGDAVVWDYAQGQWSFYTGLDCKAAVVYKGKAALARADGFLWLEEEGAFNDAGRQITLLWKTAELRPGDLLQGAHRFRRVFLTGQWRGEHKLRVRVYHNGSKLASEEWTWNPASDNALQMWSQGGDLLQDIFPSGGLQYDGVYQVKRRLTRQRGSSVSFEVSCYDNPGEAMVITELALELGSQDGGVRTPQKNTTQVSGGSKH